MYALRADEFIGEATIEDTGGWKEATRNVLVSHVEQMLKDRGILAVTLDLDDVSIKQLDATDSCDSGGGGLNMCSFPKVCRLYF